MRFTSKQHGNLVGVWKQLFEIKGLCHTFLGGVNVSQFDRVSWKPVLVADSTNHVTLQLTVHRKSGLGLVPQ